MTLPSSLAGLQTHRYLRERLNATISALAEILASAHNADAPRPPPINTTESNRASPRRDATATNNSKATYQSQDSQDSEPDTPRLPGCSVMAPPPKPDGAASPAKLAIGVVGIFGARPASFSNGLNL